MKARLVKSWTNIFGRKYPIGQVILCHPDLHKELIDDGYAEDFDGVYSAKKKKKTEFFKPKD